MSGSVSAAETEVTLFWMTWQLVDIEGATVLYFNEVPDFTTVYILVNAACCSTCTLGHCGMIVIQLDRVRGITSVHRWTCGHYFCSCGSLEAVPAIECNVKFRVNCYVVICPCSICQILVALTYVS